MTDLPRGMTWGPHDPPTATAEVLSHVRAPGRPVAMISLHDGLWCATVNMQAPSVVYWRTARTPNKDQALRWVTVWARREILRIHRDLRPFTVASR